MTPEQLSALLDELGRRIGPAGQHIYELALRQVVIDAAVGIGAAVVLLAITAIAFRPIYRWLEGGDSYSDRHFVGLIGGLIWALALAFVCVNALFFALPSLLNPEYAALAKILAAVQR